MTPKWPRPICVIDTETTGFHTDAEVVEVGAVVIREDGTLWGFDSLVRPEWPLDARSLEVLKITQIPVHELSHAPGRFAVLEGLYAFLLAHKAVAVTSYNVAFDRRMLHTMVGGDFPLPWHPCIMRAAATAMQAKKTPKLGDASLWAAAPSIGGAHRALADAYTAAHVLLRIERGDPCPSTP